MSSREIAELTGKRHDNVCRDIVNMLEELEEDALSFQRIYRDSMNREQTEYLLTRELTETLLLGYSAPLRLKVVRRLRELEESLAPRIPQTYSEALRQLADREEESARQREQLETTPAASRHDVDGYTYFIGLCRAVFPVPSDNDEIF